MSSLLVDRLAKGFGKKASRAYAPVLSCVSSRVDAPAIVSVVGPNGVGKTTFLRLLAGLLEPDAGTILLDGSTPSKCRIGYVPQTNPVLPWRRVEDDIGIPLEILGIPKRRRRAMVRELVTRFSFDLPLDSRAYTLSAGQRQLLNLCRALVGTEPPKILLLDEPFAGLDPIAREQIHRYLQIVRNEYEALIVLTTHQLDLAVRASDIIIPFRNRPIDFSDADAIMVNMPRPRNTYTRTNERFQQVLTTVEGIFAAAPLERAIL